MAISITRYVDIVSAVGGAAAATARELILRALSTNPLIPTQSYIEFTSLESVGEYFGTTSEEYLRALFYFGFVSKQATRPQKISFARWAAMATAPQVFGVAGPQLLATYTPIIAGSFKLTLAGITHDITGLDFSSAGSLTVVASTIQTAIQAADADPVWASALVTWDAVAQRFTLTGGATGPASVSIGNAAAGTPIASLLGWLTGAILSDGVDAETVTETLTNTAAASDNFGSFEFIPTLTLDEVTEAALWNKAQNVKFMFLQRVTAADAASWSAALVGIAGLGLTLAPVSTEYPELLPAAVLAATDYARRNSVQNYMFQVDDALSPSVSSDADANIYDPLRINYYGRTQTAGRNIQFYQRGVLMGGITDPLDMNVYANEIWLKDVALVSLMSLLLALGRLSANAVGRSQVLAALQSAVVEPALFNGAISVGKTLTSTQKAFITDQTGDPTAWYAVQNAGWWLDCVIVLDGSDYVAKYTLIYSKDDAVRKIEGSHQLI